MSWFYWKLNKLQYVYKCIIWSRVISLTISISMFYWINSAHVLKNVTNTTKISLKVVLLLPFTNIPIYLPWYTKQPHAFHKQILFYTVVFFFTQESIYLKYLKSLQSGRKVKPSILNDMWPHVFSSEVGSYFPCFLVTQFAHFSLFLYVVIVHLLRKW